MNAQIDTLPIEVRKTKLAIEINQLNEQTEQSMRQSLIFAARTGAKLKQAKEELAHGDFIPFLEANCTISRQYANNYMRLADEYPHLIDSNVNTSLHLPTISQAIALMTAPYEVKEAVMLRLENGESVTVKEIKQQANELALANAKLEQQAAQLAQTEKALDEKCNERDEVEAELNALLKEGGVDELILDRTAVLQAKIDELNTDINFFKEERMQAIERGVQIELTKKQREIEELDNKKRLASSELETITSKVAYRNSKAAHNDYYQRLSVTLLEKVMEANFSLKTAADSPDLIFEARTIKLILEAATACKDLAQELETLATEKQQDIETVLDTMIDHDSPYFYYLTEFDEKKGGTIITQTFNAKNGETNFKKAMKKANTVTVTGYRSTKKYQVGDVLAVNEDGTQRYFDGEFLS